MRRALSPWLVVLALLCACRSPSRPPPRSEEPLNVASLLSSCAGAAECERKCAADDAPTCVSAGHSYEFARGVAADAARAYGFYERACELGYAGGCYNAAVLLEAGKGVAKDTRRAAQLYARVCRWGAKTACERAEALQ